MYIKECGYGRSKRCRRIRRSVIRLCVLALGMGSIMTQVAAGQPDKVKAERTESVNNWRGVQAEYLRLHEVSNKVRVGNTVPAEADSRLSAEVSHSEKRKVPLVVIDPGHGGIDEGCSRVGVEEKMINLEIGLALKSQLEQMRYEVLMTRETDKEVSPEDRVRMANAANADAYVSIHQNAWEDEAVTGIETWYYAGSSEENTTASQSEIEMESSVECKTESRSSDKGADDRRLARLIHQAVLNVTQDKDREVQNTDTLYVLRNTDMPACLVETGFLTNRENRSALCKPEYQHEIAEKIAEAIDLYFNPKTMYLTFDDGPTAENTCKILDTLKEKNIKATFFVVGESVRKYPEVAGRIVAEGHTIGIHCNNHDYKEIYKSAENYITDFEDAYQAVYEVTGVKAEIFRFPGGSINSYNKKVYKEIIRKMTEKGFIYYDWNAGLEDAVKKSDPATLIQNAKESTLGRKKVIMLGHDSVQNTAICLEELLDQFPEYQMKPLTPKVDPIQF